MPTLGQGISNTAGSIDLHANSNDRHRRNWNNIAKGAATQFLSLIAGGALTINGSGALGVLVDNLGIDINNTNQLAIKLSATGALGTASGLAVNTNGTDVLVKSNTLAVGLSSTGAIVTGSSGLAANVDGTDVVIKTNTITVGLNAAGAIVTGASGLAVNVDGSTITITGNQLVSHASGTTINSPPIGGTVGGLTQSTGGTLAVSPSSIGGLQISGTALATKLNTAGALASDANGLAVKVDGVTITINGSDQLVASGGTNYPNIQADGIFLAAGASRTPISFTTPNDATHKTYRVSGFINVKTISSISIQLQLTWTDMNGTSQSFNFFSALASTGWNTLPPFTIRCNPNTGINLATILTGVGSVSYDIEGILEQLNNS